MFCPSENIFRSSKNYVIRSKNRGFLHGNSPTRTLKIDYLLVLIVVLQCHYAASQSIVIKKTMKEGLLPGYVISNLASEPDFIRIVTNATNNGAISKATSAVGNLQYSVLTSGNPHSQYFTVDPTSGVVSIQKTIDREQVCSFKEECYLTFQVAAPSVYGDFFLLVDFLITITDINDNPPEFTQSNFELFVPENSDTSRSFQLPTAFDRDTGAGNGVSEYRILGGPSLFGLKTVETGFNTSDVFLTLERTVTRENAASYRVLVGAIDGGLPPLTGTLTVEMHVSDINDNFPIFDQSLYIRKIPEDTSNDQVIEQVKATDADSGLNGELRYSFSAQQPPDNLNYFRIDALTGEIFLTRSIESRTGDDIDLVVEASDQGHPPKVSRTRVRIQVEDTINSMPDIILDTLGGSKGVAEVSEYAEIGKVVAYFSVRDPDSGDNGRTSCKLSDREFGLVKLDNDGKYKVVLEAKLDREQTDKYTVIVSCSDSGFPSLLAKADFSVKVLDENDQKPVFSQRTYETSMNENNTAGTFIIQVSAKDGDIGTNAEIQYEVIGNNKEFFNIDENGKISAKVPLDREYSDKIVATIVAIDRGSPPQSSSATVVISLIDINDCRPEFSQGVYAFEVEEQQPIGRFIGILSASDRDTGRNKEIVYRFPVQNDNFIVGAQDGVLKMNAVLDREIKDSYQFIILAVDKGIPALSGTATVIIKVVDINDNDPYFIFPFPGNNTIMIPHTFEAHHLIVSAVAHDTDTGRNAEIVYSITSLNSTSLFNINPTSGAIFINRKLTSKEVGTYTLILVASDQGQVQERSTQIPLYIDVFFDNSTLYSAVTAGLSKEIITAVVIVGVVAFVAIIVCITVICIKRRRSKAKHGGGVPNSASTSSTAKLHGGYYIAPGVRGSSSSFIAKAGEGTSNSNVAQDMGDGIRTTNPYVVLLPRTESEAASEIIKISRNGYQNGLNDTLNTLDLDQTDDGQFSTFKSQEDILSSGFKKGHVQKKNHDSSKRTNDTFDDTSCDESTSDSGRGGSDVDVNHAGAAAKQDKARAQAATPISVKSGISHRLSPLLQKEKTFATFRGDSPSSFKFDSDNDTLTRSGHRSRVSPLPPLSATSTSDSFRFEPGPISAFSGPAGTLSESDTDVEYVPRNQPPLRPLNSSGIYSTNSQGNRYNRGEHVPLPNRLPNRVIPQPLLLPSSAYSRRDSETDQSDGSSTPVSSLTRRNHVPRLPLFPGIEFTHTAFGVPRNSISPISNQLYISDSDGFNPNRDQGDLESYYSASGYPWSGSSDHNSVNIHRSGGVPHHSTSSTVPDAAVFIHYGHMLSNIQNSRPMNTDEDFLLPPYPDVIDEEADNLIIHSGFTQQGDAETALITRSRSESNA